MEYDKRKGEKPVPDNFSEYMNEAQLAQLHTIENFGWEIKYLRHPLFQEPVVIVESSDTHSIGVLENDGRLNLESDIRIR